MKNDESLLEGLATMLLEARQKIAYKGLMYAEASKETTGLDAHIWLGKSVSAMEALEETDDIWSILQQYHKKQPAVKLVAKSPERNAVRGKKSGIKPQLNVVK